MSRVSKLFDMEIDEVSVVDRPANQGGMIAIAKNDEEGPMEIFDENGTPVALEDIEYGTIIVDEETGEEYEWAPSDDREEELVDKAALPAGLVSRLGNAKLAAKYTAATYAPGAKLAGQKAVNTARYFGRPIVTNPNVRRGAVVAGIGGAAGAGYAAGRGGKDVEKSLGDEVLELLSKAVTDSDREEIIAKALNKVSVVEAQNVELAKALQAAEDARIEEAFIAKASEYNLPVHPAVLGPILKSIAEVLSDEELDILDQLFNSVGDALYEEVGYVGDTDNDSVLNRVDALANDLVSKSGASSEQAFVALMEANPDAYDAYLAER